MINPSQPLTPVSTDETKKEAQERQGKPSSDPSKATSPANIRTTFGVPKKQK